MDEKTRAEFGKELNKGIGDLLLGLRAKAGMSLEQAADSIALRRLERIQRLEAGQDSPRGEDLIELVSIYGADQFEVQLSITRIAQEAREKVGLLKF